MTNTRLLYLSSLSGLLVAICAALFVLAVFPLKYRADARILISPHMIPGVDPYTSNKSAERIGQSLAQVVPTSQFFNRVVSLTTSGVDVNYFPQDERERRKLWTETASASVAYNSGLLQISAFHPDRIQAERIAGAVAQVLVSSGNDFALSGADFRVVDTPVSTRYPAQPNFITLFFAAFFGGFVVVSVFLSIKRHR